MVSKVLLVPPPGTKSAKIKSSFDLPVVRPLGKALYWQGAGFRRGPMPPSLPGSLKPERRARCPRLCDWRVRPRTSYRRLLMIVSYGTSICIRYVAAGWGVSRLEQAAGGVQVHICRRFRQI